MNDRAFVFQAVGASVLVATTLLLGGVSFAQDSELAKDVPDKDATPRVEDLVLGESELAPDYGDMPDSSTRSNSRRDLGFDEQEHRANDVVSRRINGFRTTLKNAKSPEEKANAKMALRIYLLKSFTADMKLRLAEFNKLTERSSAHSAALEKRATAKDQLVDLQLKVFRYKAKGFEYKYNAYGVGMLAEEPRSDRESGGFDVDGGGETFDSGKGVNRVVGADRSLRDVGDLEDVVAMAEGSQAPTNPAYLSIDTINSVYYHVKNAKSDEQRTIATTTLREVLSEYFDADMKIRQQQIDEVTAAIQVVKDGLTKRAASQNDIVDLQFQIIVNEAEGLGFFRASAATSRETGGMPSNAGAARNTRYVDRGIVDGGSEGPPVTAGLETLDGECNVVSMHHQGILPSDMAGMKWLIDGNEITGFDPDGSSGKMAFTHGVANSLKTIDITALEGNRKGETDFGAYTLKDGRLLTMPAWAAPPRQPAVETALGPKIYRDGDVIEITDVLSTSPLLEQGDTIVVKGRVRLDSNSDAKLCLLVTQTKSDGREETDVTQTAQVSAGLQDFELKTTIKHQGVLHLTLYDTKTGRPFGGTYFGTAHQMKNIKDWNLDYYLND